MDAQLVSRAQAWLTLPGKEKTQEAGLKELASIYSEITNTPAPECVGCQYYPMSDTLQHFVNQSERLNNPTMSNYIWNSEYKGQTIALSSVGVNVTEENLTDKNAELAIKAGFGHVIKKKPAAKAETTTAKPAANKPAPKAEEAKAPAKDSPTE